MITSVWLESAALIFVDVCQVTGIDKELAIKILLRLWDAPPKPINTFAAAAQRHCTVAIGAHEAFRAAIASVDLPQVKQRTLD